MTLKGFIRNKQQTTGILGLLLIVLSLTGLLGCPSPTPPAAPKNIDGEFSYAGLSAVGGTAQTSPVPAWTVKGQAVEYSITTRPVGIGVDATHVTVETSTGKVTITTDALEASSGEYTVTATGTEGWQGTKTATIQITITTKEKAIDGDFSYIGPALSAGLSAVAGTAQTSPVPTWTGRTDDKQTVAYSITTRPTGANTDHVTIDTATGVVTVTTDALVASSGAYTVTATGTGAYTENPKTVTTTVNITIHPPGKTLITGTFTYNNGLSAVGGTAQTSPVPAWTGAVAGQTVEYSITTRPTDANADHVTVNTATGAVTFTDQARKPSSGAYTVTATGTGDFAGTRIATINITIDNTPTTGAFSYNTGLSAVAGTAQTSPVPIWTGRTDDTQTVEYSITTRPTGVNADHVTINTATGAVTVTDQARKPSSGAYTVTATGTGDFTGTRIATINITIENTPITGAFSYNTGLSAVVGTPQTSPVPTWTGRTDDTQTIEYSITSRPNGADPAHVTVNTATGVVTITTDALVASSGAYTVTATGTGDWQDTKTATIQITITAAVKNIDGGFSYIGPALSAVEGNAKTSPVPTWTGITDDKQTVEYSITTRPNGANATHVTVNTATGVVTITTDALEAGSGDYTVTATGTGAFTGTRIATIVIAIAPPTPITGAFTYDELSEVGGTVQTSPMPAWTSAEPGQTVEYSITSRPIGADADHVMIDTTTGVVTVTEQARKPSSGAYTITATGTGDFTGTIEASINITIENPPITGTFTYDELVMGRGTAKTSPVPTWTVAGQTVEYSITSRPGSAEPTHVTINTATGAVTVTEQALEASSGTYTLTARGIGDFGGAIEATISITIKILLTGTLSYDDITFVQGWRDWYSQSAEPKWSAHPGNHNIDYSISPPAGNTGKWVDIENGKISVAEHSPATSSGIYTVTARAKPSSPYLGAIIGTIKITIHTPDTHLTGTLNYHPFQTVLGKQRTMPPDWQDVVSSNQATQGNIEYSIAPPANNAGTGVTIDTGDGSITVGSTATMESAGTYTVTAKGVGTFAGTKTATVAIKFIASAETLTGTFSYDDIRVAVGNQLSRPAKWNTGQSIQGNIEYSITPPTGKAGTGVEINTYDGTVRVDSTATIASSGEYTVTAMGVGALSGQTEATIDITIVTPKPLTGSFSYPDTTKDTWNYVRLSIQWKDVVDSDQLIWGNIEYSLTPPDGIDSGQRGVVIYDSGVYINSGWMSAATSGTYTITAKGVGEYVGTITGTINIRWW